MVAWPCVPGALLIVATVVADELQVAVAVRSWLLPSVNVPMAVNCCFNPWSRVGVVGLTAIDTSVTGVMLSGVEPVIEFRVAVMVDEPTVTLCANPCVPVVLLMLASVLEELHVTCDVMFDVLPSP